MKRRSVVAIWFSVSMLTVPSTIALATQYVLKAPNRLALPDFKGYETTLLSEGSLMLPNWEVVPRKSSPTLTAAAQASTQASTAAGSNEIFHVAIFHFAKEHINDAITAFRALASGDLAADRGPSGISSH